MVPGVETHYTSKVDLDETQEKTVFAISELQGSVEIDTSSLEAGIYQIYLADSAENISTPVDIVIDNTPPVINNGNITVSNITWNSTVLTWNKADDMGTTGADLEYAIYWSSAINLNTVEAIEETV